MLTDTILRNRYKILKELGRGGFSVTYLAVDMDLPGNPKCVVKQLKTRHSNNTILQIAKKLFDREAQVLYRLGKGHKQIPEMFAHFEENDEFYLVQEFVDGHDLTKEIKTRHKLSEDKVIKLLQEILEVLSFVHENNVIHRDIKLRNIMRRRDDDKIVLIDFGAVKEIKGLAKNQQGDVNSTLIIGTPGYMPDEQANGKPRLCSDIYAVGMLGIQALTGMSPRELPFNPNNGELIWRDSAKVSDLFAEILTGMVRHHFSQRYQTAAEALAALKCPILIAPNTSLAYEAPPVTLPSTVRQPHHAALKAIGLIGLMGVGFGLGVFGWNRFQSSSIGNEPRKTTEISPTVQKINPSVKSENIKLSPSPTFSPTQKDGNANSPVFRPFPIGWFLGDFKKTSVKKENSKSQGDRNQVKPVLEKPKPAGEQIQEETKKPVIKEEKVKQEKPRDTFEIQQPENKPEPLPSVAIPQSEDKKAVDSEKSAIPAPQKEPSSDSTKLPKDQNEDNLKPTQPTADPATSSPNESDSVDNVIDKEEENNKPLSKPEPPDSVDETIENPATSQPSDKDKKKLSSEQPVQTPSSPNTPAIESESPSPKPTPSPVQTSDSSVVVPTAKPLLEDKNFFYTVPTSPTLIPETEALPTLSPQPTPTPEAETQSVATPQPTPIQEAEALPTLSPQPTPTPETDAQSIPQAEFPSIPETYASPSPKPEIQITPPQISASPSESENLTIPQAATPTLLPTQEPGLSLERFAI
ncbi:protein kinase domain-containing protein [Calothrix sp. CCY 0018]|uniref:protein kinase domain-containing protein n=1 Tax=Calothrix sp. CCY 0018 TaxID=3103864 RepID=UPI0039C66469